ncbi:hypothetical protein K6119_11645 [Paracrocinitomix mangrovi]|uniref:hypothetical protein n=1 Tax=Paracrocinitomix mangrovi TaxID=2862509 RepID=UPI001C8E54CC|nr:hypothetical protein [Paracrocinitomix mangrovi]UKN00388.1 hypothetical protein K6119_11645 [Paracrocinitomix mangrovi]
MKCLKFTVAIATMLWMQTVSFAQEKDSLGEIGDNLDLFAVLDAFKNAESIEAFEKTINDPDQKINNLDLNEDDEVDYIQVHDEGEDDVHAFILRIDLGEGDDETQDVAVIELEKSGDNQATIQIVGDEEIYGTDYIVEPKEDEAITKRLMMPNVVVVNVWLWPSVRFVYGPTYVRWRSPYRWGIYPKWWRPWKPYRWGVYHGFHAHHHAHFHVVKVRRCTKAHGFYVKKRRTAVRIKHHKNHHSHHPHHKTSNGGGKSPNVKAGSKTSHRGRAGRRR